MEFQHSDIFVFKNCKKPRICQIFTIWHTCSIELPETYDLSEYVDKIKSSTTLDKDYDIVHHIATYDDWKIPYMTLSKHPNNHYRINYIRKTKEYNHHIGLSLPHNVPFDMNGHIIELNCNIARKYGTEFMLIDKS